MQNAVRRLTVAAGLVVGISAGSAHAATVSGSFTDLQGHFVSWSATVDPGVTLSQQICCTLPTNQGDGTITNLVTPLLVPRLQNVGKRDPLSGFRDWTGQRTFSAFWQSGEAATKSCSPCQELRRFQFLDDRSAERAQRSRIRGGGVSSSLPATLPLFAGWV
jgi:hypothetical protein